MPYLLSDQTAQELMAVLGVRDLTPPGAGEPPSDSPARVVRVTGPANNEGWHPAKWQEAGADGLPADGGEAWIRHPFNVPLPTGSYCLAVRTGADPDGVSRWACCDQEALVRVLDPVPDPNTHLYNAALVLWDDTAGQWVDVAQVWVQDLNP